VASAQIGGVTGYVSACASTDGGIVRPRALAVLRLKDGSFADANFLVITPEEVRIVQRTEAVTYTTTWHRSGVMRVAPIPATERGCGAEPPSHIVLHEC
jgi:hypothetical protein